MNSAERTAGDVLILDLQGKILFGSGDEAFHETLARVVDSGHQKVLLNLAEVPYIDSAGISEMVRTFVRLNKTGGRLKLMNLTEKVQELLTITKLLSVLEAFDSEEEALKSFS